MKNELDHIEKCLKIIGQKFNWENLDEWTNHNFDFISDEILKETGIAISSRTLRRLAKRRIKYSPQVATKNALAQYIGYQSWEDFVISGNRNRNLTVKQPSRVNQFVFQYFWVILFVIILGLSSFFVFFYPSIELKLNKTKVIFQSNDTYGKAPHTASFFYDVTKIKSSNIFIDNNFYDEGEMIPIKKNMHYYNKTFKLPDYYAVKIIANGERMACCRVHVVTEGWEFIVGGKHVRNLPLTHTDDWLYVHPDTLESRSLIKDSVYHLEYRNIRDFDALGDQMTFETRFKNNASLGGIGCCDTKIEVINLHGRLSFNFLEPGCNQKKLKAEFGDVYLAGEFNNLNTFFQDVSYWRVLKIETKDKRVGVYLDDVQIYSVRYNDPLDEVKGMLFSFLGAGAVDYVKLFNEEQELVYFDDFQKH